MEYEIMLLNILKGKTDKGREYYRLGYIFYDRGMVADNDKFIGVSENGVYVQADVFKSLDKDSIYRKFTLRGELQADYKNPLNQVFKPLSLFDSKANYEISLLEEKPE